MVRTAIARVAQRRAASTRIETLAAVWAAAVGRKVGKSLARVASVEVERCLVGPDVREGVAAVAQGLAADHSTILRAAPEAVASGQEAVAIVSVHLCGASMGASVLVLRREQGAPTMWAEEESKGEEDDEAADGHGSEVEHAFHAIFFYLMVAGCQRFGTALIVLNLSGANDFGLGEVITVRAVIYCIQSSTWHRMPVLELLRQQLTIAIDGARDNLTEIDFRGRAILALHGYLDFIGLFKTTCSIVLYLHGSQCWRRISGVFHRV